MSDQIILSEDDVVSMAQDANFAGASTSTGEELTERLRYLIHNHTSLGGNQALRWVDNGVPCRLLLAQGGGWQKGKIQIRFEFVPDKSVSPLDDLRSQLNPE